MLGYLLIDLFLATVLWGIITALLYFSDHQKPSLLLWCLCAGLGVIVWAAEMARMRFRDMNSRLENVERKMRDLEAKVK